MKGSSAGVGRIESTLNEHANLVMKEIWGLGPLGSHGEDMRQP
jgi:hypothetical protein